MTSTFLGLPPIPQPPHDPTWWPLDPVAGWKDAQLTNVMKTPECGFLALTTASGIVRSLNEPSGSFGGVVLPRNAAIGSDQCLYLLDTQTPAIKRFDTCECRFEIRPCLSGFGAGPREVGLNCGGIAIHNGNLFLCDTANNRLSVWSLGELLLRAFWAPPAAANLAYTWAPAAAACDSRGRVYVSDSANAAIHRFNRGGVWEKLLPIGGPADALAIDRCDRIYALNTSLGTAWVMDTEGEAISVASSPDDLMDFPPAPAPVDTNGNIDLSKYCQSQSGSSIFTLSGNPTIYPVVAPPTVYNASGAFISLPLDSSISQCVWHRIILRAELPRGTSVRLSTFTAEALLPFDQVASLPEQAWSTNLSVYEDCADKAWDGLIFGEAGRYLWLRITLYSNGVSTPLIKKLRIEFPRISLRRYLPAVVGADPVSADFTDRFLALFDTVFRGIESTIDNQAHLFDPMAAPSRKGEDFLSWLGTWVGVSFDRNWPEDIRRRYLKEAVRLYSIRGTREGLRRQIMLVLGMDNAGYSGACESVPGDEERRIRCRIEPPNCIPPAPKARHWRPPELILEHFALRRWMVLGSGGLGDQANVWGQSIINRSQLNSNAQAGVTQLKMTPDPERDPFLAYAYKFTVFVPAKYAADDLSKRMLQNLLQSESPGYASYDVQYVEPRFRIGIQAMIGYDTVVGRYPGGASLGVAALGSNSVLTTPG